jgi:cytochrome c
VTPQRLLLFFAMLCPAPAAAQTGDAARGERVFQYCYSCHSVIAGETNLQGPNLRGVIGRQAGTLASFEFSPQMIAAGRAGLVWSDETLSRYVTDPEKMIPGTLMGAVRVVDKAERDDLIAYLKKAAE